MKKYKVGMAYLFIALAMASCAKKEDVQMATNMPGGSPMGNTDIVVSVNQCDVLALKEIAVGEKDYLLKDISSGEAAFMREEYRNSAWAKRKAALQMGRDQFTYNILNHIAGEDGKMATSKEFLMCMKLDGVSGFIYNLSYLCSVPNKTVIALVASDGVGDYLKNMFWLMCGGCCAAVGTVVSPIVGTLCHPIETLANLTAGVAYFDKGWGSYVLNTNLLATLWDIVWGAMLYPIWQTITFRWWSFLALPLTLGILALLWLIAFKND